MRLTPTKRWTLLPPAPRALLDALPEHPLLVQALYHRGLASAGDCRSFLAEPDAVRDNPFQLRDMAIAVDRIVYAIDQEEVICVYGDFDADGVTATALLVTALQSAGAQVGPYIPDRVDEGYGLNVDAVERIAQKARLLVTVDCGIRSSAEIERAHALGVDVIVTDHHSVGPVLPPALAVINPQRVDCDSRFKSLAGVGVAYRLAQAVMRTVMQRPGARLSARRVAEIEEELLDLVALGTVADIMPLLGENRDLVRRGLQRLSRAPRPGILALMQAAGVGASNVNTTAIGFRLGPRINAAGRLSNAMLAYRLLRTNDAAEAYRLAAELESLNQKRQSLVLRAQAEADAQIAQESAAPLLLVKSSRFLPGIVGLVAGKLADRYYRPAVVIELGSEESRGSARSIREFDIGCALDEVSEHLVRHGGHSQAAGFTVRTAALEHFAAALLAVAQRELAPHTDLRPSLAIDAEVPLREINWGLLEQFGRLEPTGQENPAPLLLSRRLRVRDRRAVGSGKHLRLVLDDGPQTPVMDAIAFGRGPVAAELGEGATIDAVFQLEANEFNGRRTLQLNLQDLCAADLCAADLCAAQPA